jgi:MSHA biogenesis protein MshG
MALFAYRGRTQRGELVTGELEAETTDAVATQLFNTGVTPIDIVARPAPAPGMNVDVGKLLIGTPKPTLDDLTFFARQMHSLTKSGVPLIRGLRALAETTRNPTLKEVIVDVTSSLESGRDLAGSLARHPEVFDPLFVNLVRVGEDSGTLEESFSRLGQYMQREKDTRQRIKSAIRYPIFVVVAISLAIAVVTIWVIPTFAQVFAKANLALPLPTRIILGFSDFMVAWWPAVLGTVVGAIFAFNRWIATEAGRYQWDRRKLGLPVIGKILFMATMARFARTLAITFRSGVPIVQAMSLVARGVANEFLAERVQGMRMGVERGESLTRTATATGLFPPLVVQMLQVGEETGRLDHMLDECADYFDAEVDYDIKNLSASIEPILTIAVGVMVLILALGVFLPMWDLTQLARR